MAKRTKGMIVGVGHDHSDGHKRITKGDRIYVVGGSKETHEVLTDKAIRFTEEVKKRGRTMDNLRPGDVREIFEKLS